jgi:hypothetical protein
MQRIMLILPICFVLFVSGPAVSQPTQKGLLDQLFSMSSFLTQCAAQKIITSEVGEENINLLKRRGYDPLDSWGAMKSGSDGRIYFLLKESWIKLPLNRKYCEYIQGEVKVFINSLKK